MTSILATPPSTNRLPDSTNLIINTYSAGGVNVPLPWRYNKRTSAIDFDFVNGFTASTNLSTDRPRYFQGQTFGAIHLVLKLGTNFIQWCESSPSVQADAGTVVMIQQPIVAYGNVVEANLSPATNSTFTGDLTQNPLFTTPAGPLSSQYYKTLVFQRQLVIQYKSSGNTRYAYFGNNFEGN